MVHSSWFFLQSLESRAFWKDRLGHPTYSFSILGMLTQAQAYPSNIHSYIRSFSSKPSKIMKNQPGSIWIHSCSPEIKEYQGHQDQSPTRSRPLCPAAHLGHDLLQPCIHRILGDPQKPLPSRDLQTRWEDPQMRGVSHLQDLISRGSDRV